MDINDSKSITKIDENTIVLHNGEIKDSFGKLYFLDINDFKIVFSKQVKGSFTNIYPLKQNKFLISSYRKFPDYNRVINKLGLCKLV